jgi:hypothetical protein
MNANANQIFTILNTSAGACVTFCAMAISNKCFFFIWFSLLYEQIYYLVHVYIEVVFNIYYLSLFGVNNFFYYVFHSTTSMSTV